MAAGCARLEFAVGFEVRHRPLEVQRRYLPVGLQKNVNGRVQWRVVELRLELAAVFLHLLRVWGVAAISALLVTLVRLGPTKEVRWVFCGNS